MLVQARRSAAVPARRSPEKLLLQMLLILRLLQQVEAVPELVAAHLASHQLI